MNIIKKLSSLNEVIFSGNRVYFSFNKKEKYLVGTSTEDDNTKGNLVKKASKIKKIIIHQDGNTYFEFNDGITKFIAFRGVDAQVNKKNIVYSIESINSVVINNESSEFYFITFTKKSFKFSSIVSATTVDADAQSFITASGITDEALKTIVNTFVLNLKTGLTNGSDLWTDVWTTALYPLVGGTALSTSVNLRNPGTHDIIWVNSPTFSSTGVELDGSTQYGRTGIIPSTDLTDNNVSLSGYLKDKTNSGTQPLFSARDGANGKQFTFLPRVAGEMRYLCYKNTSGGEVIGANADDSGLSTGTRRSTTDAEIYNETTSLGTSILVNGSIPEIELYFGAQNNTGSAVSFMGNELRMGAVGKGITFAQLQDWRAANEALQVSLSRNV